MPITQSAQMPSHTSMHTHSFRQNIYTLQEVIEQLLSQS